VTWQVIVAPRAQKDLDALDPPVARRVLDALERLAENQRGRLKRLQGTHEELRLRVGDWRVRLMLDHQQRAINVLRVRHRREAYRQ
jgi:mRNA interferase RelE/StbE